VRAGLSRAAAAARRSISAARRPFSALTAAGVTVLVVGLVAWIVAWQTGWAEAAVVAVACLIALLLCLPFVFGRPLLDVDVELAPERVSVGGRVVGRLSVRNAARGRLLPLRIELPVGAGQARFDLPSLPVDGEHEELFTIPTRRRAVVPVGPVRSVRGDALGLFRRDVTWSEVTELIVHPRITRLETLGSGFLRDLEGQVTNHLSSSDIAFHTLREYVPGDDRRYVHWLTSARTGKLMVRQFVDTRRSHAAIVVDLDPASYETAAVEGDPETDEFEVAVSCAASLGVRVRRDEQDLTFITGLGEMPAGTPQRVLDSSARLEKTTAGSLPAAASTLASKAADASIVFLITGSQTTVGTIRRAARAVSPDARVVAIRVRLGGRGAFRVSGGVSILEVAELTGLARLIRAAVA
jgi:uncharacterized protein (DUF58 family)